MIRVANPPCSWGVIENLTGETAGYRRVLDEMAETGYVGTELGHLPWTQLLGGDTILTIPPAWQRWLNASGLTAWPPANWNRRAPSVGRCASSWPPTRTSGRRSAMPSCRTRIGRRAGPEP